MDEQTFHTRRLSFGGVAGSYDRVRPSYPEAAVRWIVGDAPVRVLDLGAGTGLLSRVLLGLGHEVIAVEPDPRMRARCADATPDATVLAGSAEAIPLPDGSVDGVVAGQSYHWFAGTAAHAEIARVLRPGGVFGPLWNLRDESVEWVARLSALVSREDGSAHQGPLAADAFGGAFGPVDGAVFRHARRHTIESLVELVRSRSYVLTAPSARREQIEAGVRALAAELPEPFDLPYVTRAYRARLARRPRARARAKEQR
ncbi:MAG TPA: class I SAM-dependent methyltransferase [Streptosporangiaceae bacterium]|nr:class I SAM-dependent methyltransferase [Streptosporangiaceae bacterium]